MSTIGNGAHILVYPFPGPGHFIPLLDLTRLLLARGLTVTVLVTPDRLPLLQPLLSTTSIQPLLLSHPPTAPNSGLVGKVRASGELYDPILQWFRSHPNPPVAIVSDFFLGWTNNLARELGVPRVVFWASGSFGASVLDSLWRHLPRSDEPHDDNFLIRLANVPNSPEYPWWQISSAYRDYTKGEPDSEFFKKSFLANMESWGIVFNSFTDLERVYIDHIKKELGHTRVWAVGPLLPLGDDLVGPATRGGPSAVPHHELMTWLDGKADDSVIYVCFGSRGVLTSQQREALVAAIECSGVHFIWAMKATDKVDDDDDDDVAILKDRTGHRGFIIRGWAPQVTILRHRAVGAFVTHCGWNSVLEGLAAGVVMLTWPIGADQFTNAKLLVDQIGVAVRACEGGAESVPDPTELAKLLAESVSETGPKRARGVQLRDAALKAVTGGSSSMDLEDFINQLIKLHKQKSCVNSSAGGLTS